MFQDLNIDSGMLDANENYYVSTYLKELNFIAHVIECFNPLVRLASKGFHHNWMNLKHIGDAHIIPRRDGTIFYFIVLVKVHVSFKQIMQYTCRCFDI